MIETNLAQTFDATIDAGSAYDTNVKYLLADKQILSRILKYTIEEFQNMDTKDIMGCFGDDIEIGTKPVDTGLSNLGRVKGMVMTAELEGRIQIMCDWSESIEERGFKKGITKERIAAIERMLKANITREQIISRGYTEAEYAEAENSMYVNS